MGKHSISPARKRVFNKTMAIALAAGVSFGGVQIVGPEMGLNTVAEASAADQLDPSVVTKTELVSDKSSQNVLGTTVDATNEAYNAFYDAHGQKFKLKLAFDIPNSAQPGDTFTVTSEDDFFDIEGVINAATEEGRKVGQIDVKGKNVTFTVSEQVADAQNRKASFEIPMSVKSKGISVFNTTTDKSLDGKPAPDGVTGFSSTNEKLVLKHVYKYHAPTVNTTPQIKDNDTPIVGSFNKVNLDVGHAVFDDDLNLEIGHADAFRESVGTNADKEATYDDVYKLDETAKNHRDVTIRYVIDDAQGRLIPTLDKKKMRVYEFSSTGFSDWFGKIPSSETNNEAPYFYKTVDDTFNVTYKRIDDQTIDVVVHDVPSNYAVQLKNVVRAESPYSPGKETTLTRTFVNGVGEPHSAYDASYTETRSTTYTHPAFDGYGSADDIKRAVSMSAKVNEKDADSESAAEQVEGGKANFTIDLENKGNIGASSATVKYPKGVTGPNGETEKFIDFGKGGFPANSTKTLNLGELNVPEGANANEFIVTMTGYPELKDAAWTSTGPTDIFIDGKPKVDPDGTVTLHRNDGEDITFKVPTGSKVEVNKDGDLVITNPGEKPKTVKLKHTKIEEKGKPGTPDHKIIITDEDGNTHEFGTYDKYLKSVKDDGKGNYTFTMNDGTKLGPIKLGDDITNIADDGKGNLIVTHKDGSKDTVPLTHTTITEKGKPGDPDYAVTITTPDGKKITLDGYDNYVESIKKQPNGDYLVKRNDGTEWTIKLSDIRNGIKKLKGKDAEQDKRLDDLEDRVDGIDEEITNLGDRITKNEGAIEDHRKSINDLNQEVGSINNELGDIKDELARLDGQDIKEVRDNGDGTYTLIRNNGDEVTGTIDTSGDIKSITDNGDGTITLTKNDGSTEVVDLTHTKVETKGKPGDKDYTVTITTPDGNKVTLNGSNTYPSNVRDNGDGTYTIVLNDGSEVEGKIGDGQDIKELVPNEDGTMTIIHKDGSESVVDLKQVEITEQNKGTPEHTVTITSPNGDTVTFNVFDKYVTNVVKNESGDYDIFRSDVDGGNTVWKTIVLSDLRDKIANLEDRADGLEEKDKDLQKQIDGLKDRLDNAEEEIESLKDRTSDLEKAVAKINARLSVIDMKLTSLGVRMDALEGRVETVETTQHAWAQCFSGVLGTAIPLLAAVPFIAGSNIQIPGAAQWNNQIQRTLGIYNEKLNRMAGQYSGVIKAAATILGVAGTIGLGVHTAKACGPYSKTDAMKETKAGKLSSKVTAKREGSSREK